MANKIGFIFAKIKYVLKGRNKEILNEYFRNRGISVGEGTKIASNILSSEPYLLRIGKNVTISHDVDFITHDNSVCKLFGVDHDLYGEIVIGDNCFIGAHAVILYGVTLPDNVIVAAGSVVTKSPQRDNIIIAGNPAKEIGTWDEFKEKCKEKEIHAGYLQFNQKKDKVMENRSKWVRR